MNNRSVAPEDPWGPGLAAALLLALCAITPTLAADTPPPANLPSQQQTNYPVAGLAPNARPAGAPVEHSVLKTDKWRAQALHGVSDPVPASLKFLDDQGAWYTPFDLPGMTGPYDIRGFHSAPSR